LYTLKTW